MSVRLRSIMAATMVVAAITATIPPALALAPGSTRSSSDAGLFGASDPTYDGVLRQSYAILGLVSADVEPPSSSISWLLGQQCDDGSFMAYRSGDCTPASLVTYTGPDTNSTAAATMALVALERRSAVRSAVRWLIAAQGRDGGWPWMAGLASDPVSTGMVVQALRATPEDGSAITRAIRKGSEWLRSRDVDCSAGRASFGGVPFSAQAAPDALSTSEALLGLSGSLDVEPGDQLAAAPRVDCAAKMAAPAAMSRFLISRLTANNGVMPGMMDPSTKDWNSTALSVLALISAGYGREASRDATRALARHVDDYALTGIDTMPAALGTLLLVAHATNAQPRAFGPSDVNLVKRLLNTRRR